MRILLSIEHPAWAHQFRILIQMLEKNGHSVKVVAINKDRDLELLDGMSIPYEIIASTTGSGAFHKMMLLFIVTIRIIRVARRFQPDLFLGRASPMMALASFLCKKKHIVYDDTEHCLTGIIACKLFSSVIVTPRNFPISFGKKHLRLSSFKEIFYLHPKYFQPQSRLLSNMGLKEEDRFIVVRFVSWHASHDCFHSGLTTRKKVEFISVLSRYAKVFISSESPLPNELDSYAVRLPVENIHHLLYYATLYVGEGATMASEAAVLGTHAIYMSSLSWATLREQEKIYGLVFNFAEKNRLERALEKSVALLNQPNLRQEGRTKAQYLMKEMVDINERMLQLIERACLPRSTDRMAA